MTTKQTVEQRINDGSLRQSLERHRQPNRSIDAVVDRAILGKPLHGLKLVESGELRQMLSGGWWTEEQVDYLINRGTESPFTKALKKSLLKQGITLPQNSTESS